MHSWARPPVAAGGAVIARLLVTHALAVIGYERLADRARAAEERSALALVARQAMAGQSIGEAVGLVMGSRRLGRTAALDLLRDPSRQSGGVCTKSAPMWCG